ncbi:MAG: outer membrane protein transport protein [Algoriphagus sp.]|uniref:OmpP1/FadL family transporter n=1 Tax=Algoriphagus sp. TaxID=1872435 RepID=UPI00184CA0C3|nr:long-chain fatty acid transporter [Algoriphagus sp.]NVJ85702.1 outer membrane protein transport protein [Algoriphagus sp.]
MRYLFAGVLFLVANFTFAQSGYFEDALRFSQNFPAGSARVMALGGTQWSLGGDVSNIAGNPAGLGFFRKSEASISLGYSDWGVQTRFLGQSANYNTSNFSVPNLSVVFASPKGIMERGAFKGGSWGISIQRIANFNTEFGYFSDLIGETSILDFYIQDSFGVPESRIESFGITGLAYQTYLINPIAFDENGNPIPNPDTYDSFILGFPFQDENVIQEGSSNQITFSYGANFYHKIFVGGSLGIRSLSYFSQKVYNEEFIDEPLFTSSLRESLFINGTGLNLNIGLIYKPIDYVNIGFNFQSPTWHSLSEEYESSIRAEYNNYYYEPEDVTLGSEQAFSDLFVNNFSLNTPLKLGAGGTVFLGKNGFISADVDWVDYSAARINSGTFNEGPDNQAIQSLYTSTINYRFGAEGRINNFYVRGGYAYFGDPFSDTSFDRSTSQISGGLGVRVKNFNIDFALVNQKYNSLYRSYQVLDQIDNNIGPITEIENSIISGVLTLGLSF